MNGHPDKKGRAWHWRPVRVDGRSMIAVFAGGRVVALFGAHDIDDAHALVTLRNEGWAA